MSHPRNVTFIEDNDQRHVHADASTYYGETEYHSRSRTYSNVRLFKKARRFAEDAPQAGRDAVVEASDDPVLKEERVLC